VKGEAVCATLRGLPVQPCFNLEKLSDESFRGSISGLGFAYCEFTRAGHVNVAHRIEHHARPLRLRPSITADSE
jgi:hypothetical protein